MRNKKEQGLFETWAISVGAYSLSKEIDGSYINGKTRCAFRAWLGRSKLEKESLVGDGWVKCSERMPEIGQEVILFNGVVRSGYYYTEYGDFADVAEDVFTIGNATHWQPLPARPEGL